METDSRPTQTFTVEGVKRLFQAANERIRLYILLMLNCGMYQGDIAGVETSVLEETAAVGGGSLPGAELPTRVLAVSHTDLSTEALAAKLRTGTPRIIPRIKDDRVLVDLRSVLPEDDELLLSGLRRVLVDG